jgi:hypothetical protein
MTRATVVAEHRHAPGPEDVEGLHHHLAAGLADALRDGVRVVGAHVGGPHRRLAVVLERPEAGDVAPVALKHPVAAALLDRAGVGRRPAEEPGVEALRRLAVGRREIDP